MNTATCALVAMSVSWLALLCLALGDPKRLRSLAAMPGPATLPARLQRWRAFSGWAVPLPGAVLAIVDAWPAFLIWLGGTIVVGWLLALALAPRRAR